MTKAEKKLGSLEIREISVSATALWVFSAGCMEKLNSLGSMLAALSSPARCRRTVRAGATRGLAARGRPLGAAVKSTHQSSAAISCFFLSRCLHRLSLCSLDCVVFVLHYRLSLLYSPFLSDPKKKNKKRERGRTEGKKSFSSGSMKTTWKAVSENTSVCLSIFVLRS